MSMTVRAGVLGATGAVGQRFVQLLADHPTFDLVALTASEDSAGRPYREAAKWRVDAPVPGSVADRTVRPTAPDDLADDVPLVFSALPSGVASEVEPAFAEAGAVVCSNASNERMADDVPLVVPEVNPDHLALVERQRDERGWAGALVKNPNCSTVTFVPPLSALDEYGVERVHVATLQAVSGAGYAGVTSMEILDNVLPHIPGEAEKLETESRKLLGTFDGAGVEHHPMTVSASVNRVPTLDGHLENVWVETAEELAAPAAADAVAATPPADLPSAPDPPVRVFDDPDRPQPRLDRGVGGGMAVAAGGFEDAPGGVKFDCLAHNTLRGAAGASVLNAELLVAEGYL